VDEACGANGEKRNVHSLLVIKSERKRPQPRPRRRLIDNIKNDLSKTRLGGVDWISLAMNRHSCRVLVNALMNLRVP
jgi:hypothetical protein